ncbi:MAG: FAD-dependent oxidoreductase [Planctomycetota bacterium]
MSVSWWRRGGVARRESVDAVVVGGGVCGVSAALYLSERGLRAVCLERHAAGAGGAGASARNAGYLMRGAADNYAAAAAAWGRETARDVWRWSEENLAMLRARGVGGVAGYRDAASVLLAVEDEEAGALERSAELMREDGFGVALVERGDDSAWRAGGGRLGLVNEGDAAVNPAAMMRWMVGGLAAGTLREHAEVFGIERTGGGVVVRGADGRGPFEMSARAVFVCTNAWASRLVPSVLIEPNRAQMLAARVSTGVRLNASYYVNHGHDYVRMPEPGLVVVGGRRHLHADDEQTESDGTSGALQADLEAFLGRFCGERGEVVARWAGTMGLTPGGAAGGGLPVVEEVEPGVVVCAGFNGHGMSLAHRLSSLAVGAWLGEEEWPAALGRGEVAAR